MITVQKFCWCCRLEVGGLVIGWLTLICQLLGFLGAAYLFISSCNISCPSYDETNHTYEEYSCSYRRRESIGENVMRMVLCIGIAYISFIFIQGTKARNHRRVRLMLIFLFAGLVILATRIYYFCIIVLRLGSEFAWYNFPEVIIGIPIAVPINIYFFVVVYSLYSLFRREHKTGGNPNGYRVQYAGNA